MARPKRVKSSLAMTHPAIAAEAYDWDPSAVTAGSGKKKTWICPLGHIYEAIIGNRAGSASRKGTGCPYCAGKKVLIGFNDLQSTHPHLANEASDFDPKEFSAGSNEKVDWICPAGHPSYPSTIAGRVSGRGCPVCSGNKVYPGFNDLATTDPDLAKEAYEWDPRTFSRGSSKKKSWKCLQGHPPYEAAVHSRAINGSGCPMCAGNAVTPGVNDLLTNFPDIASEANGWDPCRVAQYSNHKLSWICSTCNSVFNQVVQNRTRRGDGCMFCSHKVAIPGVYSLRTEFPEIVREADGWDPDTLLPYSNRPMPWICGACGHHWQAPIYNRTGQQKSGCPACAGKAVIPGVNDLWTIAPSIAKELLGEPLASDTHSGSHEQRDWECSECSHTWEASVKNRVSGGTGCPACCEYGYDRTKAGWMYLMVNDQLVEQQIGISNNAKRRVREHEREGWQLLDENGPASGGKVEDLERHIKRWIRSEGLRVRGKHENWSVSRYSFNSIQELCIEAGLGSEMESVFGLTEGHLEKSEIA